VTARLNLTEALIGNSLIRLLAIIPLSICFFVMLTDIAWANAVLVGSEPVKRGSVTPGSERVVMQTLTLKTDSDSAQLTSVKLNEFGTSDATPTISSVKIYKETNGVGGLQFSGTPDTLLNTTPQTFDADETVFTFETAQVITTSPTTYYIVYSISKSAITNESPTVGSRLNDETYLSVSAPAKVEAFTNLQSREITVVAVPHGSPSNPDAFTATNLCQTCHAVHLAPEFGPEFNLTGENRTRRILVQPYFESPSVVNNYPADTYNALCFSCHDGTGASTDIKGLYNTTDPNIEYAGHETTRTGSITEGYKPPPSGQQYNAGVKLPCMVCHDAHSSDKANYKMLADNLYDYAINNGWVDPNENGRIDSGDEACLVCHKRSTETERTSIVFGISLDLPPSHDEHADCLTCHNNAHALDAGN